MMTLHSRVIVSRIVCSTFSQYKASMLSHTQKTSSLPTLQPNTPREPLPPVPTIPHVHPYLKLIQQQLKESIGHVVTNNTLKYLLNYIEHHQTLKELLVAPIQPRHHPNKHLKQFSRHHLNQEVGRLAMSLESNRAHITRGTVFYGRQCLSDYFCLGTFQADSIGAYLGKKIQEGKENGDIKTEEFRRRSNKKSTFVYGLRSIRKSSSPLGKRRQGGEKQGKMVCMGRVAQQEQGVFYEILRLKMLLRDQAASHEQIMTLSTSIKSHLQQLLHRIRLKPYLRVFNSAPKTTRILVR